MEKQKKKKKKSRSPLSVIAWWAAAYRPWGGRGEFIPGSEAALISSRRGLWLLHHALSHNDPTQHFCDRQPTNCTCLVVSQSDRQVWAGNTVEEESESGPEQSLPKTLMSAYIVLKFLGKKNTSKNNCKGNGTTLFLLYCFKICYMSLFSKMLPGYITEFYSCCSFWHQG